MSSRTKQKHLDANGFPIVFLTSKYITSEGIWNASMYPMRRKLRRALAHAERIGWITCIGHSDDCWRLTEEGKTYMLFKNV